MSKIDKSKIILLCIVIVAILIGIVLYTMFNNNNINNNTDDNITYDNNNNIKNVLFTSSHISSSWEDIYYEYNIYSNGEIELYDRLKEETKSARLTKNELEQLTKLANELEDEYESHTFGVIVDGGTDSQSIWSDRLSKWIVIKKSYYNVELNTNIIGSNTTETSKKILELTDSLYDKYLK